MLLDIGLPGGDRFVVMERFTANAELGCIPAIVITGRDPVGVREGALQSGAVAFFENPADNDKLLAAIRGALGETAPPRAPQAS